MSRITDQFVATLAHVWHRFDPPQADTTTLADMLAPMDDAGEALADDVEFDMEPSDFILGLEATAASEDRS